MKFPWLLAIALLLAACLPETAPATAPAEAALPSLPAGSPSETPTGSPTGSPPPPPSAAPEPTPQPTATPPARTATFTPAPPTIHPTASAAAPRSAESWQTWPVIPDRLSPRAREVYRAGLAAGNRPTAFSKIGDGEVSTPWLFSDFDYGTQFYNLGEYSMLQAVLQQFAGSFARTSQAARRGFNAQRILDPYEADPQFCASGETPLACELRLHRPSIAILSLGTNQVWQPEAFEAGLRQIIETLLANGVLPILSTKADNLEGDQRINGVIARLAVEYDLPLWNFWLAVQPLPDHGLQADGEHLTWAENDFANPAFMQAAWPVRNLTALQTLAAVWQMAGQP